MGVERRIRYVPVVPSLDELAKEVGRKLREHAKQPIGLIIRSIILGVLRGRGIPEQDLEFYRAAVHTRVSLLGVEAQRMKRALAEAKNPSAKKPKAKKKTTKQRLAELAALAMQAERRRAADLAQISAIYAQRDARKREHAAQRAEREDMEMFCAANYDICPVDGFPESAEFD